MLKRITKKIIKKNFTYLNTNLQKQSTFKTTEDSINYFIVENNDQIAELPDTKNFENSKSLKKIQNYPNFSKKSKSFLTKLESEKDNQKYHNSLRGIVNAAISTTSQYELDSLNINSLIKDEKTTLDLLYHTNYLNFIQTNKKKDNKTQQLKNLNLNTSLKIDEKKLNFTQAVTSGKNLSKQLLNTRADTLTPFNFTKKASDFAKLHNLKIKTYKDTELLDNNLNLIYAVGKGSENRPSFLTIEYKPLPKNSFTALIGKGVTFDTGGNNIKPTGFMEDMFADKGGACSAFASFTKLVELEVQSNIVLCIPLAENSCDGKAYRPSDIVRSFSGLTVEVNNTDAEGRLLLADAMSWVQSQFDCKKIIEFSTLTGACVVALGFNYAGVFCNSEELARDLFRTNGDFEESLWRMPLDSDISEGLKGGFSDVVNSSRNRYGGAIEAAEFLRYFVDKDTEWAHIDIAGVVNDTKLKYHKNNQPLASGFGVGTVLNYFNELN